MVLREKTPVAGNRRRARRVSSRSRRTYCQVNQIIFISFFFFFSMSCKYFFVIKSVDVSMSRQFERMVKLSTPLPEGGTPPHDCQRVFNRNLTRVYIKSKVYIIYVTKTCCESVRVRVTVFTDQALLLITNRQVIIGNQKAAEIQFFYKIFILIGNCSSSISRL